MKTFKKIRQHKNTLLKFQNFQNILNFFDFLNFIIFGELKTTMSLFVKKI